MHRNVTVVIIILILVVIAGYLVWLRSRFEQSVPQEVNVQTEIITPTPSPLVMETASPSATPITKQASPSAKPKSATSSAAKK